MAVSEVGFPLAPIARKGSKGPGRKIESTLVAAYEEERKEATE
jgi:hypothetical protein